MRWVIIALVCIVSAAAQIIDFHTCPDVKVKPDFDASKFIGKWYEAQRYFTIFEIGGKCVTATYTANKNGTIGILNKQIYALIGIPSSIQGYATQDEKEPAKLSVVFPSLPYKVESPYWVLDTDYDSFAVIWSCKNIFSFSSARFAWILTREQNPEKSVLKKAYAVFDDKKLNRSHLQVTNQKTCPKDSENSD